MFEPFDAERYEAYERLLTKPDPPELPRRGHVRLCEGDPNRRATRLPPLHMGWLQRWCLENFGEEPPQPPPRRHLGEGPGPSSEQMLSEAALSGPPTRA